jgi:hypothetical protein
MTQFTGRPPSAQMFGKVVSSRFPHPRMAF